MKRIRNILEYKKIVHWKLAGGIIIVLLTLVACATDAKSVSSDVNRTNNSENSIEKATQSVFLDNSVKNISMESNRSNYFTQNPNESEDVIEHRGGTMGREHNARFRILLFGLCGFG